MLEDSESEKTSHWMQKIHYMTHLHFLHVIMLPNAQEDLKGTS